MFAVLGSEPLASARSAEQVKQGSPARPEAAVSSAFTYQGQLIQAGAPADGQYDFVFTLYDAAVGGNQVGVPVTLDNQAVSQGFFTVPLDFGAGVFQGEERWLEMAVRQAGAGAYATLSPRQALTAAPYAMSLMPGSTITGNIAGPLLQVQNTGAGGGVFSTSTTAAAGVAGVYGVSTAFNGTGTIGEANNGSLATGVWGKSATGLALYGQGRYGVFGSGSMYGVYGSVNYGIYGQGSP
jgi:hypothetical protein